MVIAWVFEREEQRAFTDTVKHLIRENSECFTVSDYLNQAVFVTAMFLAGKLPGGTQLGNWSNVTASIGLWSPLSVTHFTLREF